MPMRAKSALCDGAYIDITNKPASRKTNIINFFFHSKGAIEDAEGTPCILEAQAHSKDDFSMAP